MRNEEKDPDLNPDELFPISCFPPRALFFASVFLKIRCSLEEMSKLWAFFSLFVSMVGR